MALIQRMGRRDEIAATRANQTMEQQGNELKRMSGELAEMRDRMGKMETSLGKTQVLLWEERGMVATLTHENGQLRRGLKGAVDDLNVVWEWIDGDRTGTVPARPNLIRYRNLLDEPRPRRPPPPEDRDAT